MLKPGRRIYIDPYTRIYSAREGNYFVWWSWSLDETLIGSDNLIPEHIDEVDISGFKEITNCINLGLLLK